MTLSGFTCSFCVILKAQMTNLSHALWHSMGDREMPGLCHSLPDLFDLQPLLACNGANVHLCLTEASRYTSAWMVPQCSMMYHAGLLVSIARQVLPTMTLLMANFAFSVVLDLEAGSLLHNLQPSQAVTWMTDADLSPACQVLKAAPGFRCCRLTRGFMFSRIWMTI